MTEAYCDVCDSRMNFVESYFVETTELDVYFCPNCKRLVERENPPATNGDN